MKLVVYVGAAILGVAASSLVILIETQVVEPKTAFPAVAAASVVGGLSLLQSIRGGIRRYRIDRSEPFIRTTSEALGTAFLQLCRLPGLSIENVGISAWMVQRRLRKPWQTSLVRVGRLRLTATPLPSRIIWTKGKGIIGRCWETENVAGHETATLWEVLWNCGKTEWDQVPNHIRLRLNYREWRRIRGKYEGALAVPFVGKDSRFLGCVSVDVRTGSDWQALNRQDVVDIAAQAGTTIANLHGLVSRWVYTTGG